MISLCLTLCSLCKAPSPTCNVLVDEMVGILSTAFFCFRSRARRSDDNENRSDHLGRFALTFLTTNFFSVGTCVNCQALQMAPANIPLWICSYTAYIFPNIGHFVFRQRIYHSLTTQRVYYKPSPCTEATPRSAPNRILCIVVLLKDNAIFLFRITTTNRKTR